MLTSRACRNVSLCSGKIAQTSASCWAAAKWLPVPGASLGEGAEHGWPGLLLYREKAGAWWEAVCWEQLLGHGEQLALGGGIWGQPYSTMRMGTPRKSTLEQIALGNLCLLVPLCLAIAFDWDTLIALVLRLWDMAQCRLSQSRGSAVTQ